MQRALICQNTQKNEIALGELRDFCFFLSETIRSLIQMNDFYDGTTIISTSFCSVKFIVKS